MRRTQCWPFESLISKLMKHGHRFINLDKRTKSRNRLRKLWGKCATLGVTNCLAVVLRFCEFANAIYLTYIVFAQTLGAYQV